MRIYGSIILSKTVDNGEELANLINEFTNDRDNTLGEVEANKRFKDCIDFNCDLPMAENILDMIYQNNEIAKWLKDNGVKNIFKIKMEINPNIDKIDEEQIMDGEFKRFDSASGRGVWKFVTIYNDGTTNVECIENEDEYDSSAEDLEIKLRNKKDIQEVRVYKQVKFFN